MVHRMLLQQLLQGMTSRLVSRNEHCREKEKKPETRNVEAIHTDSQCYGDMMCTSF